MYQKSDYIAVFDSGVGGISVLRHLIRHMPGERFLYFGDSANAPYGSRPTEEVKALTLAAAEKLVARGIKALVVACNTATSAAIEVLRQTYPEFIIVGIEPALKVAADRFPTGRIGVMATEVTLREEKFDSLVHRVGAQRTIYKIPAPGLVELIEQGAEASRLQALLEPLLRPYAGKLDALVLGCTHYPFATERIRRVLGDKTQLLDGGEGTARQTRRLLEKAGLLGGGSGRITWHFSAGEGQITRAKEMLR